MIDAAEELAAGDYRSAPNALAVMARGSPLYKEATARLKERRLDEAKAKTMREKAGPYPPAPPPPSPSSSPALCGNSPAPQPAEVPDE